MPIKAIIFDLDGTLVQTEVLKGRSYAKAAKELSPGLREEEVLDAFGELVGKTREEVAQSLLEKFNLEEPAKKRMEEFNVQTPWEAFVKVRMNYYQDMLADMKVLNSHLCKYNISLLGFARKERFLTGLATMSHREQALSILEMLGLDDKFDCIMTRDEVSEGKPDPEIYTKIAENLQLPADQCLVIEDSVSGIESAQAAGMQCIVVTNALTRKSVNAFKDMSKRWIVNEREKLAEVVRDMLTEQGSEKKVEVEIGAKSC